MMSSIRSIYGKGNELGACVDIDCHYLLIGCGIDERDVIRNVDVISHIGIWGPDTGLLLLKRVTLP